MRKEKNLQTDIAFASLANGSVAYQLSGTAKNGTVVLIAGLSIPMFLWDPTYEFLIQNGFQVLRFDLYGRGQSSHPQIDMTYDVFIEQLDELLEYLNISTPIYLFGTSMGAPIAAQFAQRYPKRIKKLVLSGPVGFKKKMPLEGEIVSLPILGDLLFSKLVRPILVKHVKENFLEPRKHSEVIEKVLKQTQAKGFSRSMLSTIRHAIPQEITSVYRKLGKSKTPILVFCGQHDLQFPIQQLRPQIEETLPKARVLVFEKSNHLPHFEEPKRSNQALLDFFLN